MGILRQPVVQMPTQSEAGSDEQDGFSGGFDPAAAVGIVAPNICAAVTNMRLIREMEMAKRPGLVSVGSLAGSQFYPYAFGTAPGRFLALTAGSAAAIRGSWASGTLPSGTAGLVSSASAGSITSTATTYGNGAQFRDATSDALYVAVVNAASGPFGIFKWNGTALTEGVGSAGYLSHVWVYNQRLFGCKGTAFGYGGVTTQNATLYWSGLNNGDTIGTTASGGGSAEVRTFGGQNIMGGFALGGSNFILHEDAISVFRGLTFDDISITAGTVGVSPAVGYPMTWKVIDHVGYIVTTKGFVTVTEANGVTFYDRPETPDPILQYMRTTLSFFDQPCSIVDNARANEIWVVVPSRAFSGTVTTKVFIYHKRLQRFTGTATFTMTLGQWFSLDNDASSTHQPQMLVGTGGTIYGCDFLYESAQAFTDAGSVYASSVQLRRFYTAKPSYQKAFRFLNVNMGAGGLQALTATGANTGATVTYATTAGGTVVDTSNMKAQEVNIIQLSGQGSYLDATITDGTGSSSGWSVLRADVDAYILAQRAG